MQLLRPEGGTENGGSEGKGHPGVGTLLGVIAQLIQQMIVEGRAAEGGGHDLKANIDLSPKLHALWVSVSGPVCACAWACAHACIFVC